MLFSILVTTVYESLISYSLPLGFAIKIAYRKLTLTDYKITFAFFVNPFA